MRLLHELSLGERIAVTVVIVLAILFALALFGYLTGGWEKAEAQPITCVPDEETKEKVRSIMLDAMEQALKDHVVRMHEVWMKDERGQPARATNGTRQGLRAYLAGRAAMLTWNPPLCRGAIP